MAAETPVCNFDWPAPDFDLPTIDGGRISRETARGPAGLLVVFLCNHCPYVRAIERRLAEDCRALRAAGIGVVGIASNDTAAYPEDGPDGLREQVRRAGFDFPYAFDATQAVARAYGAVCTPDFFGFNAALALQYRGRFDASRKDAAPEGTRRELLEAMRQVAASGQGPRAQMPSIGCSIKWREETA